MTSVSVWHQNKLILKPMTLRLLTLRESYHYHQLSLLVGFKIMLKKTFLCFNASIIINDSCQYSINSLGISKDT